MSTAKRDTRAELERTLSDLGLKPQTYRALMLLPLVYVAWADGKMDHVESRHILDFASRRLHLTADTAAVLDRWMKEAPSQAYVERGLQGLLGVALDEHMLEVDVSELPELVLHAETIAAVTGDALHDPNSVTPEEEEALREIARLLEVQSGEPWKRVLDSLRTIRPPSA
jgi:hypothetical protein